MIYEEVLEKLKEIDEITLLEVLEITSEDLVNEYEYKIQDKLEQILELFDKEEETDNFRD